MEILKFLEQKLAGIFPGYKNYATTFGSMIFTVIALRQGVDPQELELQFMGVLSAVEAAAVALHGLIAYTRRLTKVNAQ